VCGVLSNFFPASGKTKAQLENERVLKEIEENKKKQAAEAEKTKAALAGN